MPTDASRSTRLERTLGLPAALSIGIGTMVGAGIFIFPGIAAGQAGPAAMLSFALGGLVALLVALSTAELATAMPESGGGYYFVSRTFGPLAGTLVGIAQWVGLVFASAFYLVGFGQYTADLLREVGLSLSDPAVLIALGTALLLTGINLFGTQGAGRLQNGLVVTLTSLLTLLFGYGVLEATGLVGAPQWPIPFAPYGYSPVFTTAALVFTSYLGFVQIATVAGEVTSPHRTLPRALVGSVLVVTALYVLALFVSTSVLPAERLAELGETAMVEVARSLVGRVGALGILAAGLLATLSSANASILSSSRAVFALSRDRLVPAFASRVNARFGTPHRALIAVGAPIAGLTLLGRLETLAEVASLLHLVIYGLLCAALPVLRRRQPRWYAPTFRVPGGTFVAVLGALASFGLIAFMQPLSLMLGGGLLALALVWYAVYARGRELKPPRPPHIVPELRAPRILLPVELPEPSQPPFALLDAFRDIEVFILAYWVVPEQTSPEHAEDSFGEEAQEALDRLQHTFAERGLDVPFRLAFTSDVAETLDRYVRDRECQAVLTAAPIASVDRLVVPLYAQDQVNTRLATIVCELAHATGAAVQVVALRRNEDEQNAASPESLLRTARRHFIRGGLPEDRLRTRTVDAPNLAGAGDRVAGDGDLVILGEPAASVRTTLFSTLHEDIRKAVPGPVLVVLQETDGENAGGAAAEAAKDG